MTYDTWRLLAVVLILLITGCASAQPETKDPRAIKVEEFRLEQGSILQAAYRLSRASGVPVCVEEERPARKEPGSGDSKASTNTGRTIGSAVTLQNVTVADVLNEIIKLHRAYVWSYDSATGMANLFPRDRNILSWRVTDVDFKDKTLREIFISDDLLSLRQHGIAFFRGRGNLGWLDDTKVSLKAQNTQARLLLNQLCSQLPFAALWHVELHEPGWQGATATLMFKGFAVKPRSPEQSQDDAK